MAKTLADIRTEYPQYDKVDDKTLADALYKKYYSHADRRQFDARIGLDPYDNPLELAGKVAQNIGPSLTGSLQTTAVGAAELAKDIVQPEGVSDVPAWQRAGFDSELEWFRAGAPGADVVGGDPILAPLAAAAGMVAKVTGTDQTIAEGADAVIADQARKRAVNDLKQALNAPDVEAGSPEELAYNVLFAATDMAAPMTASILMRNPAPMAAYGAVRAGSEGYQKARNAGLDPGEARAAAGLYAASEAATEWLGTKLLLEGGKTALRSVLRGAASEGLTEAATEALNALIDAGVLHENMSLEEVADRVKMAGQVGAILGGPLGGIGHMTRPGEPAAQAEAISESVFNDAEAVEDTLALPAPAIPLALPAPSEPTPQVRRQPPAPEQQEPVAPTEEELDFQAYQALRKTRQNETAALLQTARETIAPLGSFDRSELPGDAVQRVATWRMRTGKNPDAPITIADMANAKVPQTIINEAIALKRPMTSATALTPDAIREAAEAKNLVHDDLNFKELAYRTTGSRDIERMTQTQLNALRSALDAMPAHDTRVTVPIADAPLFDEGQYSKALDAVRNDGRFTLKTIKDATGLKADKDAKAIRDAMVRRGQLVERGPGDYRLYDVLGAERQAVPDDLPKGAFSEYVVKRTPVNRIQIKVDGKSIGTFGSGTEARNKIRELRQKEAEKGGKQSRIELGQAEEAAWAVMENRYDEAGNVIGQVVVDTSRDEAAARKLAQERNSPTQPPNFEIVPPSERQSATPAARGRSIAPNALVGRTQEVIDRLNAIAQDRALPLLGTKVQLTSAVRTPSGEIANGVFADNLIRLTTATLDPDLTTDQVIDRLAGVMDHELIHALRRVGVLAPDTKGWQTLERFVNKAKYPGTNETYVQTARRIYGDRPGYGQESDIVEEAIAEAFRVWAQNRRNVVGQPAAVFRQIVEWFRRLFGAIPEDVFRDIETGALVRNALRPPGSEMPRARAAQEMADARRAAVMAERAKDLNKARNESRAFLRARDQAREDRYGRSGPKTVIGTTPNRAYTAADPANRELVDGIVDKYRATAGISTPGLSTYLPEDMSFMSRVADAQQKAVHDPGAVDVAKAYRALTTETRSMFDSLGIKEIERWNADGQPYASPEEMIADIAAGRIKMRLSNDMFGPGADNPGHPMNVASGRKTTDGSDVTFNDLFRVVHDVYGRGPIGLKRDSGRDDYNAYHEHARLLSPEARRALATETLAQSAWHHYGPHLRRRDGTVPRERDVDYLPADRKEFAEQKAFLLPQAVIDADPGWVLAEKAAAAVDPDVVIEAAEAAPKFSLFDDQLPGGRLYGNPNRSPGGAVSAPDTPTPEFSAVRDGNSYFGGEFAEVQLQRARDGQDGTTMLYLSPDEFIALTGAPLNPEQDVYDALVEDGYKFNTMPSLVIDGYAGKVRAVGHDGGYAMHALRGRAERIPVVLYPKRKENLGLVSAIDGNGTSVPWPADGRAENYLDYRGEEPRYMVNAQYGNRVPSDPENLIDQRVEGWVGRNLAALGRSKKDLPVIGSIFDLRVKFQDRMLSVKEMIETIKEMGGKVSDETDVYMAEQLAGSRTVQEVEAREARLYEPVFNALREASTGKNAVSAKDLEDYLYARHAPERNAYLRASGSKVPNPSGMSDSEANTILDGFALANKLPKLEELARLMDAIVADTTRTRVAAGLISQEAADQSPYEYYVPLRGKTEEDLDPNDVYDRPMRARSGKGYTIGGKEDRSAVGRERKAGDIIANVMLQNTESVIRAEKNRVAMSFMRLIQDNPNSGFGKILSKAPTRMVRGANGMIREAGDPSFRQRPDIFTAKWKGREIVAQVDDPRVARAMRADYVQVGGEPSLLDKFVAGASRINRYLATINTSWNPEFLISNLARDAQTAGILGAQYDIKGLSGKIIKDAPAAMLAIKEVLRDGTASTPMARYFQEMQKAGGTTEFLGIHDLDTHIKRLRADAARTGWQPTARQAFNRIQTIGKFIDDYNKVAENAFRLGAYAAARDAGVSVDRAAFLAKNLTVNFNKGGEQKALMNSLYLFYNASISGTFVLLNGLKNKRVQKLVAGIVAAGALQDMLNRMLSGDEDDNGVKDYDDIPDYVLETNWVFMLPGSKEYISIPMPYGFNFFHNAGRNMSNAFSGSPVHNPGKSAMSTLMTAISSFNPIGGVNSPLNFIAPTFADPLVDLATNKDFAGNDIVPERPTFGLEVPDSQKYWANTGDIPKWTAEQLNRLTGGNEVRPGAVDISPEVLQYWIDYVTGATGKFVQRNWDLGANITSGDFEDIEIGDIPFARRVVGSVTNRGNTERYYETATEVKTVAEELKRAEEAGNAEQYRAILRDKGPEAALIDTFTRGEKELSELRKEVRALKEDTRMDAVRKRDLIRTLEEKQDQLMALLNKTYFDAKGFAAP